MWGDVLLALAGIALIWLGIRGLAFESPRPSPDFGNDDPYIAGLLGSRDRAKLSERGAARIGGGPGRTQSKLVIAHDDAGLTP